MLICYSSLNWLRQAVKKKKKKECLSGENMNKSWWAWYELQTLFSKVLNLQNSMCNLHLQCIFFQSELCLLVLVLFLLLSRSFQCNECKFISSFLYGIVFTFCLPNIFSLQVPIFFCFYYVCTSIHLDLKFMYSVK